MTRPRKRAAAKPPSKGSRRSAFRAAIAQFAPVYLDKAASLSKAIGILQGAKKIEVELLVFGETWLPGYPAWLDVAPKVAFCGLTLPRSESFPACGKTALPCRAPKPLLCAR